MSCDPGIPASTGNDSMDEMIRRARAAFETVRFWPQEKVDEMVQAVAWKWLQEPVREELARLAVEESGGLGVYEDKKAKIRSKTLGTLWDQREARTCGLVEENRERGIRRYAKPMGVVANVVPCTNPESTVCCIGLSLLKTRNAMIVSPHPRTQETSFRTVEVAREALAKIGAPVDLLQCIRESSREKTRALMSACDFAMATGGAALAKVVHGAGRPAQTVGAGNVVSIVDETADPKETARKIMLSKLANNSASCSSENAVALYEPIAETLVQCLKDEGGHLCNDEERETLRRYYWPDGKTLNRDLVAQPALTIARAAGLTVPESTRFLMVEGIKPGPEDRFSGEKLSPTLTVWRWTDFDEMLDRLDAILRFSGEGHSVSLHSERDDRREKLALRANVGRVVCNMPHAHANSGGWNCGLPFTDSLGGGTWAGNATCENINWRHFLNYTLLAVPAEPVEPDEEELFADYLKRWGRD